MKSVILLVVEMLHIGMWVCISETLSKRQVSFRESMGNDIVAIVAIWLSYQWCIQQQKPDPEANSERF